MDKFKRFLGPLLLVVAIVSGAMAVKGFLMERNAGSSYDQLQAQASEKQTENNVAEKEKTEEAAEPVEEMEKVETVVVPIDFEQVQAECPDCYAWIRIPDTNIDYPIMQSATDNAFYLDHNGYGEYEYAGSIFTEDFNKKDFSDPNTVIYGHNMKNGSMFQNLHLFEDRSFMDEHSEFYIYTPEKVLTYKVFASYNYDDRHLLKAFDFTDKDVFRIYLQEIRNQRSMSANIDLNVEVTKDDRIVTLSTCNGIDNQRYLVQGVLLSEVNVTEN